MTTTNGVVMNGREYRLRLRIDRLTAERDWHKARAKPQGRRAYPSFCVYCGERTKAHRYPSACSLHHDLLALDPLYSEAAA